MWNDNVFVFLPISQLERAQYATAPHHADRASLAVVYTMIARAIGITHNFAQLRNVKADKYFWTDATQTTRWKGPVKTYAILGALKPIAAGTPLNGNKCDRPDGCAEACHPARHLQEEWRRHCDALDARHALYESGWRRSERRGGRPWTGTQIQIDPKTKKVVSPSNFPLANFKVNGYQPVTLTFPVSDTRLKRDIVLLSRLDNGIGIYRYRYVWGDDVYVGVMAQEVADIVPAAIVRAPDGYLRVDYARLGLHLQTWQEWLLTHGGGAPLTFRALRRRA